MRRWVLEPLRGPGADGRRRGVQRWRVPPLRPTAGIAAAALLVAKRATRAVASAAMRQTLGEVGAMVPLGVTVRSRSECGGSEEQELPAGQERTKTQRRDQTVRGGRGAHRIACHQIRVERVQVGIGDAAEMIVGEGRVQVAAVPRDAFAHRPVERRLRPTPDPGGGIGGDVGAVQRAELGSDPDAASEGTTASDRMATRAIPDPRQIGAVCDRLRCEARARGWRDLGDSGAVGEDEERHEQRGQGRQQCQRDPVAARTYCVHGADRGGEAITLRSWPPRDCRGQQDRHGGRRRPIRSERPGSQPEPCCLQKKPEGRMC